MDQETKNAWSNFLNGYWQKEMPQREGRYPTATRDRLRSEDLSVVRMPSGELGPLRSAFELANKYEWGGWWWSEPLPELPKPPPWKEDVA